ncbi:hypothetical protein MD484_g3867, partial [Candolleomyces efflorescens]
MRPISGQGVLMIKCWVLSPVHLPSLGLVNRLRRNSRLTLPESEQAIDEGEILSYVYLVNHFDNPEALKVSNWSFRLAILFVAGPPLLSNAFYVSRLWIIGVRNIPFLLGMGALMLTRFTFQIILAAKSYVPLFYIG